MTAQAAASINHRRQVGIARKAGDYGLMALVMISALVIVAASVIALGMWVLDYPNPFPGNHQPVSFQQLNWDSVSGAIRIEH